MKNKKTLIISLATLFAVLVFVLLFISNLKRNENKLTLAENQWIESNKYNVVDISVLNNIPILSYNGEGVLYSYINYVSDMYSLKFNLIPYSSTSTTSYNYSVGVVSELTDDNINLMEDNLALVLKNNVKYSFLEDIQDLKLAVMETDKQELESYFEGQNVEFVAYDTNTDLSNALLNEAEGLSGAIVLKSMFMKEIIERDYVISYNFDNLHRYYVLKTAGSSELNSILMKGYNLYKAKKYNDDYKKYQLESYFRFKKISDIDDKTLKSKSYVYGFIDYGIYSNLSGGSLSGLNGLVLKDFNEFSNLSMTYVRYNSISSLLKDFNEGKVDFILDIGSANTGFYKTVGVFDKNLLVVSGLKNQVVVDSINSLRQAQVLTIKDSFIENYLLSNGIRVKSYNNMKDLSKDFKSTDITVVDLENYNYYKTSAFKNAKINYLFNLNDGYSYCVNNTSENRVFGDLLNFYLNFTSINRVITLNYDSASYKQLNISHVLIVVVMILLAYVVFDLIGHVKKYIVAFNRNRKLKLSKEDKIKYIDQLTSLKNRAYFNSKIDIWNDSEIYPQAIIIVDLNNISYVNDNFGREEGDKVITEAANILIQNQLVNTELIRTDGNEFLIYMVGYDEKEVVTFLRKLNKEFKNLSHGFGAASGYSMITDELKTVDDAVNEATLDMKNNKEDIEY